MSAVDSLALAVVLVGVPALLALLWMNRPPARNYRDES